MYNTDECKECLIFCQEGHISCPCETNNCDYDHEMQNNKQTAKKRILD